MPSVGCHASSYFYAQGAPCPYYPANLNFPAWNFPLYYVTLLHVIEVTGKGRPKKPMQRDVWIFLLVIGVLFFSWPILSIFKDSLAIYLFVIWFVFIALIFVVSVFSKREDGGG
jgi:hypothetical protein